MRRDMRATTMTQGVGDVTLEPEKRGHGVRSWLIGLSIAGFVFAIGMSGGGYEMPASGEVVIIAAWLLLIGSIMGLIPDSRPTGSLLAAFVFLFGLAVLSLLSIAWSDAAGRSVSSAIQVSAILSTLLLGGLTLREDDRDSALGGLLAGVSFVAAFAVESRFHPGLAARPVGLAAEARMAARLHWPIGYWNTLGFTAAMAVPLALNFAAGARNILFRAAAAAALPVLALCILFTLSRGSILVAAIGVVVFLILSPISVSRLLTTLAAAVACGLLVASALARRPLMDALTASGAGASQAATVEMLMFATAGGLAGLAAACGLLPERLRAERSPRWAIRGAVLVGAIAAVAIVFFAAGGGPRLSRSWEHFKSPQQMQSATRANQLERLTTESSNGRWQIWTSAINEGNSKPLAGTGAGTFELWWSAHAPRHLVVRNAHSEYLEIYAELGLLGVLLITGFVLSLLIGCFAAVRRAGTGLGSAAAGTAAVVCFLISTAFDWGWQVTLVPAMAMLAFAATAARNRADAEQGEVSAPWRAATGALAGLMLCLAVPPVVATQALTKSQVEFNKGDLTASLTQARAAVEWQPYSAAAWLQRGLVYDSLGDSAMARESIRGAISREPNAWRNWLALAQIEARSGHIKASVAAYKRARDLNPTSPLFAAGN